MATATTRKPRSAKLHSAHVQAYVQHELASVNQPEAEEVLPAITEESAEPAGGTNLTLAQALAESGESLADLKEDAPKDAKKRDSVVVRAGTLMINQETLEKVRQGDTRQGAGLNLGRTWYTNGIMAPSIRHAALEALVDAADEDGMLSYDDALEALRPLAKAGVLGCSTPVSRISKFLRSGHLLPA